MPEDKIILTDEQKEKLEKVKKVYVHPNVSHAYGSKRFFEELYKGQWDAEFYRVPESCQLEVIDILGFDPRKALLP